MTASGVCTQIAATVPTMTIMNAAAESERMETCALQHCADDDGEERQQQANNAENIHEVVCPYAVAGARDSRILSILSLSVTAVNGLMT